METQINEDLSSLYILWAILAASFGTALTRFLPFFALKNATNNAWLRYLRDTMPLLIMTLLVFFSLKDTPWSETYGLYEVFGIFCASLCFVLSKNSVLSIFAGIIFYIFALNLL
ncbi:AzlD domain-containing protein [Helicobacter sp. MIT 05-5294]|uniref:branched-chain amino acid transporter permease n=1 Tax=Helicobacter sp. MIT 05-5294 TaxID=1548150 RepID=UPI00051F914D|nr:AzlD domain-containing protein [Helicobacter sp. MIT 05-5294]TLD87861.1 AzlD domain-containing protein [Helicobacter sp. MIT 05-5294]